MTSLARITFYPHLIYNIQASTTQHQQRAFSLREEPPAPPPRGPIPRPRSPALAPHLASPNSAHTQERRSRETLKRQTGHPPDPITKTAECQQQDLDGSNTRPGHSRTTNTSSWTERISRNKVKTLLEKTSPPWGHPHPTEPQQSTTRRLAGSYSKLTHKSPSHPPRKREPHSCTLLHKACSSPRRRPSS